MNKELVNFILKVRRIGYGDLEIKKLLSSHGWPTSLIKEGFLDIKEQSNKIKTKQQVNGKVKTFTYLDKDIIKNLESRAKKNA